MSSLSGLEIGLCFLFGGVILVFSAELCYLIWWKKKFSKCEDIENKHFPSSNITPTIHTSYTSCWKTSKSLRTQEKDMQTHVKQQESESDMGLEKDLVSKSLSDESLDLELMRLHNLSGPPRFLFTINEETKEDLESERSKRGSRTMSDILDTLDTPFLSPLASPALKIPQHPNVEAYYNHGLNPLFESSELGMNKIRSSPPPTFKFLRDAEEKLLRRLKQMEIEKRTSFKKMDQDSLVKTEEKDGAFVKLIVSKGNSENGHHQVSIHSKVKPLDCSPSTTMAPIDK